MAEWISVKYRLPDNGCYLVCKNVCGYKMIDVVSYTDNLENIDEYDFYGENRAGWYDYDHEYGYYEHTNITHWMQLPELPKDEGDK